MYDHNTQRPRGFGFITYDSEEAVDKVLQRTFHELNGKIVEVKRAVPKESSLGSSRNQLGGYNLGLGRVNSFLKGYMQGYNTNSVGGYGVRMEVRSSHSTIGQSGFSPWGPGYEMGLNFDSNFSPSSGWNSNLSSNLSHGRGLNTSFNGILNRFAGPFGYDVGSGVHSSVLNSAGPNIWGNGSLSYATNPIVGSRSGKTGASSFGSIRALWDSSPNSCLGGGAASAYGNHRYASGDFGVASGGIGHERTGDAQVSSHGGYADFYEKGSHHGDSTWRSLPLDLQLSISFDFGLRNTPPDIIANNSAGYIGGYSVTNRQTNEGKT
ncbi:RNA-binding family protein isoform 4 [Hibiscus syriacus]|uniref:RNA-binding family protein isoform 4 n=1 Tax=Hibiscus syriacus TaxID=106335 RepID=A0A6A2WJY8_HIBSY|nr:RNA-binding family protein isoform 4 [Hibiscus syriacus]